MTIGERIKKRRIELGMTQLELAKRIGFKSRVAVSKIESDDRNLRQNKIKPVAEALNVSVDWLMGWDEEEDFENTIANLSPAKRELVSKFIDLMDQLTEEEIQEVVKHMEFTLFKRNN